MAEQAKVPAIRFAGFTDPWEQRKLGELSSEFQSGDFISAEKILASGPYPVYGGNGLRGYAKRYNHDGFYALIGRQGALCGNVNTAVGKAYFTEHAVAIKANSLHDTRFLVHLLRCMDLGQYSGQSAQPGLAVGVLKEVETTVPSKVEQQAIGSFFSRLDDLITLHQRKYDKLVIFKKSMLEKMFPKDGESVPEIRFAGFTDPWEQRKLGEIASFSKGSGYSKADIRESGIPLFLYGRMYTQYETRVDSVDTFAAPRPGTLYSKGTEIVVPASGESAEDIARASAITREGIALGGDLNVVYPQRMVTPLFLAYGLSHGSSQKMLAQKAQGKTVVHIHASDLKGLGIAFPDVTEQQAIGTFFSSLDDLITLHQRKLELLQNIKKSLLDKMFV